MSIEQQQKALNQRLKHRTKKGKEFFNAYHDIRKGIALLPEYKHNGIRIVGRRRVGKMSGQENV